MAPRICLFLASLMLARPVHGAELTENVAANPIRRVVSMLQAIAAKVDAEAARDEDLHKKFMCYCKTGTKTLEKSITDAAAKISEIASAVEEAQGQKAQLEQELGEHKSDRAAAQKAIDEATAIRGKEAAAYASMKSESESNIGALNRAVVALEKGMGGAFLQTGAAKVVNQIVSKSDLEDAERQTIVAFLSGQSSYAPQSGQITGLLKQLGDEMSASLAEATTAEEAALQNFEALTGAKKKEIAASTAAIEDKSTRLGELGVKTAEMKADHGDTVDSLSDDKEFLADLEKNCGSAQTKYDAIVKERSEEKLALAETIKLLNDDDALELFRKTLPGASASFLQVATRTAAIRARALAMLRTATRTPGLDFIALALHGKRGGFEKVIVMIDEMIGTLKKEQVDDDSKKEYCAKQFDLADDKKKGLERSISDSEAKIEDAMTSIATLSDEIKMLKESIKALDASVAEATAQRKAEHAEYTELMASNTAAKELIGVAKNRLNKLYNKKLYKAPPKRELTEAQRIEVNMGGSAPPTPAPGGIAGTGITALAQISLHAQGTDSVAPQHPPEAVGDYAKKSEEAGGVIAMMDLLVQDLDKEMTIAETEEKDSQGDYEGFMKDSARRRADDSKTLGHKESAKADAKAALQTHEDNKASSKNELMATAKYIQGLHAECDWLLQYHDVRKEARVSEISSLGNAKAVLSGADYSLIQEGERSLRGRK